MREQSFPMQSYLEQYYPFWPHLNPKEQEQLCSCSQLQTCQKGDFLYSHDDDCLGILLVLKGQLRIFIQSGDTREITLFRVGDGQVCTLSASCIIQEINFDIQIEADEDTELISIYYGEDFSQEEAETLGSQLEEAYPSCDVEVNYGGQPIYYCIISVE